MPIVTRDNLDNILEHLSEQEIVALDLETTGVNPYQGNRIFSAIVSTSELDFYFNFY